MPNTSGPREGHPKAYPSAWKPEVLGRFPADADLPRAEQDQSTREKAKEIREPPPEEVLPQKSKAKGCFWAGPFFSK